MEKYYENEILRKLGHSQKKIIALSDALKKYHRDMFALEEEVCAIFRRSTRNADNVPPILGSPLNISDPALTSWYKQSIVELYEKGHLYDWLLVEEYLSMISKGRFGIQNVKNAEDVLNIKHIIYTAEEPYKSLLLANIHRINIVTTKTDQFPGSLRDGGFCAPVVRLVFFSLDVHGLNDPRGPYATFFHETGHGVDDASKVFGYETKNYIDSKFQKKLHEIIEEEAHDSIRDMIGTVDATEGSTLNTNDRDAVLNAVLYGGDHSTLNSTAASPQTACLEDMHMMPPIGEVSVQRLLMQ